MSNYRVGIVGGGVVGLSSALHLAQEHRNLDITVISEKDITETTSFGPPGLFRPSLPRSNEITKRWAQDSFDRFTKLAMSIDGPLAGCQMVSGYVLSDNLSSLESQEKDYGDIVTDFRWLNDRDMEIFTVPFKHGFFYSTVASQSHYYVKWIAQQAISAGCKFARQKIYQFTELSNRFDAIINCSGLEAGRLVPDESVIPVRGVAIKVAAPWIKHFLLCDDGMTYIIPGIDCVFLGTVRTDNSWKTTVDISEREIILKRCGQVMPSLKQATFIGEWAGLRPYRPIPRLELEHLVGDNGKALPIIHNYGHGGNGITLSWGCAKHVGRLLNDHLRMKSRL